METYSPYCDRDLSELQRLRRRRPGAALRQRGKGAGRDGGAHAADILAAGKRPVMLGGEHLVTLGAVRAVAKQYPDLHILHLDAHTDLRDDYLGETLSHATVIRRVWELLGDGRIHQFGIRSGEKAEFEFADAHTDMHRFTLAGLADTLKALQGKPVYLTLDLDVLDPSVSARHGHAGARRRDVFGAVGRRAAAAHGATRRLRHRGTGPALRPKRRIDRRRLQD